MSRGGRERARRAGRSGNVELRTDLGQARRSERSNEHRMIRLYRSEQLSAADLREMLGIIHATASSEYELQTIAPLILLAIKELDRIWDLAIQVIQEAEAEAASGRC